MHSPRHRGLALTVSIFFLLTVLLAGCGTSKTQSDISQNSSTDSQTAPKETSSENTSPLPSPTSSIKVTLYFPTSDATGLAPVERTITVANQEVIQALFTEFNNPPSGLVKPLPDGTQLLDAKVNNGVATLSLSKSFKENFEGGATGEQMILYSIVNTLTAQADIQSVVFLLEGEKTVAILGELDTTAPIKRNESLVLKQ